MDDIAQQDYQRWRHHPVSAVVLRYLDDYANTLVSGVVDAFLEGSLIKGAHDEARGRVKLCRELSTLSWSEIRQFYGLPEEQDR